MLRGIEASEALYDWDWRQLLASRSDSTEVSNLYGPGLPARATPLRGLRQGERSLLLIDELDRADDEFDAFLLDFPSLDREVEIVMRRAPDVTR